MSDHVIKLRESITKWPIKVKIRRAAWQYLFHPVFAILPGALSRVKVRILIAWGSKIENPVLICYGVRVLMPWKLNIEGVAAIGKNVDIYNFSSVTIGSNVVISQDTLLCTGSHDYTDKRMPLVSRRIVIKSYVWLAAGAFIGPGVTINEGAVIGARCVLTRDADEWTVFGGNPARKLKRRIMRETENKHDIGSNIDS